MMTFREFLRKQRRKTTKGVEQSGHGSLNPDNLIRVDDWRVRLRWRTKERVRVVHVLEA
jgi:hypothetical protein